MFNNKFKNKIINSVIKQMSELYDKYAVYQTPLTEEERDDFYENFVNGKSSEDETDFEHLYDNLGGFPLAGQHPKLNKWVEKKHTSLISRLLKKNTKIDIKAKQEAYYIWGNALMLAHQYHIEDPEYRLEYLDCTYTNVSQKIYSMKIDVDKLYELVDDKEDTLFNTADKIAKYCGIGIVTCIL